jgi:hypothetical protein
LHAPTIGAAPSPTLSSTWRWAAQPSLGWPWSVRPANRVGVRPWPPAGLSRLAVSSLLPRTRYNQSHEQTIEPTSPARTTGMCRQRFARERRPVPGGLREQPKQRRCGSPREHDDNRRGRVAGRLSAGY